MNFSLLRNAIRIGHRYNAQLQSCQNHGKEKSLEFSISSKKGIFFALEKFEQEKFDSNIETSSKQQ